MAQSKEAAGQAAEKDASQKNSKLKKNNEKYEALESFARALHAVESMYVEPNMVHSELLIDRAIKGMLQGLDPHTTYLPPQQLKDLTTDTSGKFGGIGVVISNQGNKLEIVEVMPQSPAFRAGVQVGEALYAIDGVVVTSENAEDLLSKMRGTPGSSVKIDLYFPSESKKNALQKPKTRSVTITREVIKSSSVFHTALAPGYVYLRMGVFQEDTSEETDLALRQYEQKFGGKLQGLILDLRNNPGGLLEQAVKVANLFIESGIIVSTIGRDRSKQEVEYASKRMTHPLSPLVVLVNEGSASASEIVAGALQDHDRALIMGARTFGKGSVQSIVPLPNDGGIKVTIARYYTPKGRSIQAKGITPDIVLASPDKSSDAWASQKKSPSVAKDESPEKSGGVRREVDLEGHIEGTDLSNPSLPSSGMGPSANGFAGGRGGFVSDMEKWAEPIRQDAWIRTAYTYLKSWSRFEPSQKPSTAPSTRSEP